MTTKKEATLSFPARLVRGELKEVQQRLLRCIGKGGPVRMDAGNVLEVDATGVQLLLSFLKSAETAQIEVQWTVRSKPFVEAFDENRAKELLR